MNLLVVGCTHHTASVAIREQLAFNPDQTNLALRALRNRFPDAEAVLLSTCNRVELYAASSSAEKVPSHVELIEFLAEFHELDPTPIFDEMFERAGEDAVRHLFTVAASLDSMVVGEAQILSQVKKAFAIAQSQDSTGPIIHQVFESANRVAKRVATETSITRRRVSIPSVAVGDYAQRLFETFSDKKVLVIGAGDMAEDTLRYLRDAGVHDIVVVNRNAERAEQLAARVGGRTDPWKQMQTRLAWADLVVSTTGASQPIVTAEMFREITHQRAEKLLFVLDLAVPRDFDPAINEFANVYLYCIDDLKAVCEKNRRARKKEWPLAQQIIEQETSRLMADWQHRVTVPTIRRLKQQADEIKQTELNRLVNKIGALDPEQKAEIERSFDRLVNKLLHPPLESLRDAATQGTPHGLLDALRRLFQIDD